VLDQTLVYRPNLVGTCDPVWGEDGIPSRAGWTVTVGQPFVCLCDHCTVRPCSEIFDTAQVYYVADQQIFLQALQYIS